MESKYHDTPLVRSAENSTLLTGTLLLSDTCIPVCCIY